jgi:hypothetical protein
VAGTSGLHAVDDERLRSAVAASRSWREVARALGLPGTSSRVTRQLRERCERAGIDHAHFRHRRFAEADLAPAVRGAATWDEVLRRLGYAERSGSARQSVRGHCARLGIDVAHLEGPAPAAVPFRLPDVDPVHLRTAGGLLVAAALALRGVAVSWPLEPATYDLLADLPDQGVVRVQVKTTTQRVGGTWLCHLTRGDRERYGVDAVDCFGLVDGDRQVHLVPSRVLGGLSAVHLSRYAAYRLEG